ncbi:hypothetical protein [Serratia symbiotica]|uniref:hypothetical protein n=1 Tax=Serratia symbiotica TaxID=138074 RepID=UPI0013242C0C|nr:hypothetical protein [Serratia symbiotica]QTP13378.1 hypothetical protein GPZ83_0000115 [Serratia symbiotica]
MLALASTGCSSISSGTEKDLSTSNNNSFISLQSQVNTLSKANKDTELVAFKIVEFNARKDISLGALSKTLASDSKIRSNLVGKGSILSIQSISGEHDAFLSTISDLIKIEANADIAGTASLISPIGEPVPYTKTEERAYRKSISHEALVNGTQVTDELGTVTSGTSLVLRLSKEKETLKLWLDLNSTVFKSFKAIKSSKDAIEAPITESVTLKTSVDAHKHEHYLLHVTGKYFLISPYFTSI